MASSPQKNLQFISPPKEAGDFLQNQVKQWGKGSLTGATTKIDYYPVSFTSTCYGIFISDAFGYLAVGAEVINNTCFKIYTSGDIGYVALFVGK